MIPLFMSCITMAAAAQFGEGPVMALALWRWKRGHCKPVNPADAAIESQIHSIFGSTTSIRIVNGEVVPDLVLKANEVLVVSADCGTQKSRKTFKWIRARVRTGGS